MSKHHQAAVESNSDDAKQAALTLYHNASLALLAVKAVVDYAVAHDEQSAPELAAQLFLPLQILLDQVNRDLGDLEAPLEALAEGAKVVAIHGKREAGQ